MGKRLQLFRRMFANIASRGGLTLRIDRVHRLVTGGYDQAVLYRAKLSPDLRHTHSLLALVLLLRNVKFSSLVRLQGIGLGGDNKGRCFLRFHQRGANARLDVRIPPRTVTVVRHCHDGSSFSLCLLSLLSKQDEKRRTCNRCHQRLQVFGCGLSHLTALYNISSPIDSCATHRA